MPKMESRFDVSTKFHTYDAEFVWNLKNWNDLRSLSGGKVESRKLTTVDGLLNCRLTLRLPHSKDKSRHLDIAVNHIPNSSMEPQVSAFIRDKTGSKSKLRFSYQSDFGQVFYYHYDLPDDAGIEEHYEIENSIVLSCSIKYVQESWKIENKIRPVEGDRRIYESLHINNNYKDLLKDQQLLDLTIVIGSETIKAHAVILAAACPYFLSMFEHENTTESRSRTVDLSEDADVTAEVFRGFIEYVYGLKSVADLGGMVHQLIVLADKYGMDELQRAGETYLSDTLTPESACETLLFAYTYNCQFLRRRAIILAKNNPEIVRESREFQRLCECKELVMELLP